jgi:hypothetical protein
MYFIILLFIAFTFHRIGDYGVETDFYWLYVPQAKEVLKGILPIDAYKGPIYQSIVALFSLIFAGDFFRAGIFINILSASLILLSIFKIIDLISNRDLALITVIFTATNRYFIKYSYSCSTDMVFMVLFFLSVFYLLKSNFWESTHSGKDIKSIWLAGLFCSLAYLTRYTSLSLIISVFLYLMFQIIKIFQAKNNIIKKELIDRVKKTSLFFIPNFVLISIWGIICLAYKGSFFYNDNFLNTAYTVYKSPNMSNNEWTYKYQIQFHSMYDVIFKDFGLFVKRIFIENFTSYFVKDMSVLLPWYIGIFTCFGLIFFFIKHKNLNFSLKFFIFLSLIFYFFPVMTFYSERFSLPLLPLYLYLMIYFVSLSFIRDKFKKRKIIIVGFIIVIIIASVSVYRSFTYIKKDIRSGPKEILLVSEWVKNNYHDSMNGKTVLAYKPHIAYYTNSNFVPFAIVTDYKDLLVQIKEKNVDYLYISTNDLSEEAIESNFLLDTENPPAYLEPIYVSADYHYICVLYKVKK